MQFRAPLGARVPVGDRRSKPLLSCGLVGVCGSAALSRSGCRLKPAFQAVWAVKMGGVVWSGALLGARVPV